MANPGTTIHTAKEFSSPKALKEYLKEHPKADPARHHVKGKPTSEAKPKEKGPLKVKVDEAELKAREPKIESTDLKDYPATLDVHGLEPDHREEIAEYKITVVGKDARQAVEIARKIKKGLSQSADICKINPAVCTGNLGLTRDKMPQIEGEKSVKQLLDSKDALEQKKGKAMVQAGADPEETRTVLQQMIDHLGKNGIKTTSTTIPVGMLKATQAEIKADKTYKMADAHLKGKFDKIDDSVVVSKDGHILDGHHRWAALLTIDPGRKMNVKVLDMNMKDLLKESQAIPGVYKADFEGNPLDEDEQKKYKSEAKSKFNKKKKSSLRDGLIRLAFTRPEFRSDLLRILG